MKLDSIYTPRHGSGGASLPALADLIEIDETSGCWIWTRGKSVDGYGRVTISNENWRAHRVFYTLVKGPIGNAMLDHLCRNRACVNPDHLEPVDCRTNLLRGDTIAAANAAKSHCNNGHPLSGDNLRVKPDRSRVCRACQRESNRKRQQAKNAWARNRRASEKA